MERTCAKCKTIKSIDLYTRRKWPNGRLGFHSYCNPCRNTINVALLHKKRQPRTRQQRKSLSPADIENKRTRVNASNKQWRMANPDKWKVANRLNRHRRRALGNINSTEWIAKVMLLGNKCQVCYKTEPEVKITIDHIIPVSKGGTNHIENLQPLCMTCNRRKHAHYDPAMLFALQAPQQIHL